MPQTAAASGVYALEGDIGRRAMILDCLVISQATVALVGRDFSHFEVRGGRVNKVRE